eukprot:gene22924-30105_t
MSHAQHPASNSRPGRSPLPCAAFATPSPRTTSSVLRFESNSWQKRSPPPSSSWVPSSAHPTSHIIRFESNPWLGRLPPTHATYATPALHPKRLRRQVCVSSAGASDAVALTGLVQWSREQGVRGIGGSGSCLELAVVDEASGQRKLVATKAIPKKAVVLSIPNHLLIAVSPRGEETVSDEGSNPQRVEGAAIELWKNVWEPAQHQHQTWWPFLEVAWPPKVTSLLDLSPCTTDKEDHARGRLLKLCPAKKVEQYQQYLAHQYEDYIRLARAEAESSSVRRTDESTPDPNVRIFTFEMFQWAMKGGE